MQVTVTSFKGTKNYKCPNCEHKIPPHKVTTLKRHRLGGKGPFTLYKCVICKTIYQPNQTGQLQKIDKASSIL